MASCSNDNFASTNIPTFHSSAHDTTHMLNLSPGHSTAHSKTSDHHESAGCSSVPRTHVLSCLQAQSPNGTVLWFPQVPDSLKPVVGASFDSFADALKFYKVYAEASGFTVKKSSSNRNANGVYYKLFRCTRCGQRLKPLVDQNSLIPQFVPEPDSESESEPEPEPDQPGFSRKNKRKRKPRRRKFINRKSTSTKFGCEASLRIKIVDGKHIFFRFFEGHNHKLVSEIYKNHLPTNRQVDFEDVSFLHDLTKANVGASSAHRLKCNLSGGYEYVGPSTVDYKNLRRSMKAFVEDSDAHIVVETLTNKKQSLPNFSFEYCVDHEDCLMGIFWADNVSRLNYKEFGDIVSFDATYGTNKYNMVFVPLTGLNNHKKLVVFGAAMLAGETQACYEWFLDCFLKTFQNEPGLVATDQDPAMKEAIKNKFKIAKHRLCMWHISQKLQDKVTSELYNNDDFIRKINRIFWDKELTVEKFEDCWKSLMDDYDLHGHRWFNDLYKIKERWNPCFFRDIPMNGLMRTSSLSESENAFFKKCKNKQATLVDFFTRYDDLIQKQRHSNTLLEFEMETKRVNLITSSKIESFARNFYTPSYFLFVQDEVFRSSIFCNQISCVTDAENEDKQHCVIQEKFPPNEDRPKRNYKVCFDVRTRESNCTCLLFSREGRLCRHIFCVYDINDVIDIPSNYLLRRWSKDASETFNSLFSPLDTKSEAYRLTRNMFNKLRKVVLFHKNDVDKFKELSDKFDIFIQDFLLNIPAENSDTTLEDTIQKVLGYSKPDKVLIHPPKGVRNKGQRGTKRIMSSKEKAIKGKSVQKSFYSVKPRACKRCGKSGHNVRTCPGSDDSGGEDSGGEDSDCEFFDGENSDFEASDE